MEQIVVTGSPVPRKRSTLASSYSVITSADIEFQNYDNVGELLRHVPGLHVEQAGSRGARMSVYLRGIDPNLTLILVDGIPLNDSNKITHSIHHVLLAVWQAKHLRHAVFCSAPSSRNSARIGAA